MRLSCNGCRVLRKGCSDTCIIKPCLGWIESPEAQANATLFLAKFYGRAGLVNLINAGPNHLRPVIFKSLLYEACGRIVNPIYGSTGLLWTGSWNLCQAAVEAVLKGTPITPVSIEESTVKNTYLLPFKACDIRHVSWHDKSSNPLDLHKALKGVHQTRFKRSGLKAQEKPNPIKMLETKSSLSLDGSGLIQLARSQIVGEDNVVSAETVGAKLDQVASEAEKEVELELTLGFGSYPTPKGNVESKGGISDSGEATREGDLGLGLALAG